MICPIHKQELGEGMLKTICLDCSKSLTETTEQYLAELREKQKTHKDTPLCCCDACV